MIKNKNWIVILFLICCLKNYSTTYIATGCPATWTGFDATCPFFNGITRLDFQPATGDILIIPGGCTVTVSGAITVDNDITLIINGQLKFNGAGDKLNLSSGCTIVVNSSGSISGPSSSNQIRIGTGSPEWSGPGTSTGPFTLVDASLLPIELIDFSGKCLTNGVQLNWSTATELNNDYFEIERSADGVVFQTISTVKSKSSDGNSLQTLNYETNDANPLKDISYYRLKQTDFSKGFTTSKPISISINRDNNVSFVIFPNPNNGEFYVNVNGIENNHEIEVLIYDNKQSLIYNTKTDIESIKSKQFNFKLQETLKIGLYNVLFVMEGVKYKCSLVIQ